MRGGGREVLGHPLPGLLTEHAAGRLDFLGVPPPWVLAIAGGVAVVDLARPATGPRVAADRTDVVVAASIGIATDDGHIAPVPIVEQADLAMYGAKAAGRSRWSW